MYRQTVEPILAAAGFEVVAHETEWRGHATQIVAGEAVGTYEAVVAVGGDGTVFEVLQVHTLMYRPARRVLQYQGFTVPWPSRGVGTLQVHAGSIFAAGGLHCHHVTVLLAGHD